ncbi:hypothetical protein KQI42_04780 [Tissierella sp. MSJ-40]|uniref:Uncharacterized protein n=1 Tax=Tissierella simiarum TaxID=2841534 RepID=A0ABS6E318_9FIRM|nr:hypothetical protein [Tissierella simiarum]MBU5437311.1 hypothetical protein [Tissierella simiarum]
MSKMNYCVNCRRIDYYDGVCSYCQSDNIKTLETKAPVNVIGTKTKGRVLNVKGQMVNIICVSEDKSKYLRECEAQELQKIL